MTEWKTTHSFLVSSILSLSLPVNSHFSRLHTSIKRVQSVNDQLFIYGRPYFQKFKESATGKVPFLTHFLNRDAPFFMLLGDMKLKNSIRAQVVFPFVLRYPALHF